jgi:DNA polymerase-3 subunit beta
MQITVDKKLLGNALRDCSRIVPNKTTLPVLTHARMETGNGRATLTTTDLDMTVTATFACDTQPEQHVTVFPVKQAKAILPKIKSGLISMRNGGKEVAIYATGCAGEVRLPIYDVDEFPAEPQIKFEDMFIFTQSDFKRLLTQSRDCISTDETRYVLNGVFLSRRDLVAHVVATDGRRLVHDSFDCVGCDIDMIIQVSCVNQLLSTLGDKDVISIGYCKHTVPAPHPTMQATVIEYARFKYKVKGVDHCVVAKLVDGNYPNYRQVIPETEVIKVMVDRKQFIDALCQVALVTSAKENSVKLNFNEAGDRLTISAKSSIGNSETSIPITSDWKKEITEAFNPAYLVGPLSDLECDVVVLHVTDELTPIWITIPGQPNYRLVVMPMRLS